MAVCEDHWGDCNDDYRDGCEQPIEHRVYCNGDSRIREYSPATIDLYQDGHAGPGELDAASFDRQLERDKPALQSCYDRTLEQDTKLEATLRYRFHIDKDRDQLSASLIASEPRSDQLESCVNSWAASIRLEQSPKNGPVDFDYRVVFVHSRREGD